MSNEPLISSPRLVPYPHLTHSIRKWVQHYTTIDFLQSQKKLRNDPFDSWHSIDAWIVLSIVGLLSGLAAFVIETASDLFLDWRLGYCRTHVFWSKTYCCTLQDSCTDFYYWNSSSLSILLGVLLAALSCALTLAGVSTFTDLKQQKFTVFYASGSGLAEIKSILSGFVIRGCLGLRTLFIKTLALIPAIASGLMVGQQGPLVFISCAIGNVVSRFFPKYDNEAKKREILSAAASAGVSVAFGAPIGGVLFALEEISYYFPLKTLWRSFYCALIAAFTLKVVFLCSFLMLDA